MRIAFSVEDERYPFPSITFVDQLPVLYLGQGISSDSVLFWNSVEQKHHPLRADMALICSPSIAADLLRQRLLQVFVDLFLQSLKWIRV